jgi:hypothetical protein
MGHGVKAFKRNGSGLGGKEKEIRLLTVIFKEVS